MYTRVFLELALAAGDITLKYFRTQPELLTKSDGSPVTLADREAEAEVLAGLARHFPDIPVVAEEETEKNGTPRSIGNRFFLVDPLDGTREFINSRADYTVNIALIEEGVPVEGVVYAPAKQLIYWTEGGKAFKAQVTDGTLARAAQIHARPPRETPVIVASRSHRTPETDAFCEKLEPNQFVSAGSSLKFGLVAEGMADIYPRFGRTMEWDTAAGDAVLRAAGGKVITLDGQALRYGKTPTGDAPFANPDFIALGLYPVEEIQRKIVI